MFLIILFFMPYSENECRGHAIRLNFSAGKPRSVLSERRKRGNGKKGVPHSSMLRHELRSSKAKLFHIIIDYFLHVRGDETLISPW